jgi:hypothetical protein
LDAGLHALHPFFRLRGDGKCRATRPARRSSLFRLRGTIGCRAPRPAPGNFPLVRKVTKGTAGVPPLHSLRSASAVTLLPAELRIVHSRKVPASVSAPQGADFVIPSEARNLPFGGLFYRRWGFFGACAPQNDRGFGIYRYAPTNYTRQRAEREIDATTMRLRATRTAVTINGQDFRHRKEITRNAVSGFLFSSFFKSEKGTRGRGRNPRALVPRRTESCIPRPPAEAGTKGPGLCINLKKLVHN